MKSKKAFSLSIAALFLIYSSVAFSVEFQVNSELDVVDKAPGDGICESVSATCSLRAAVMEANALEGKDSIRLPAGMYALTVGSAGEDFGAEGDLDILDDLDIIGDDRATTTISGGGIFSLISVMPSVSGAFPTVRLENMTLADGGENIASPASVIINYGQLSLENITIKNGGANKYAIGNVSGTLSINKSIIKESAVAIYTQNGLVTLSQSFILANSGIDDVLGSGLISLSSRIKLLDVKLVNNQNQLGAAGLYASKSDVEIYDSAIRNNIATGMSDTFGGGLFFSKSNVIIKNVELSDNDAITGGAIYYVGENISSNASSFMEISNTVIRNNTASYGGGIFAANSKRKGNRILIAESEISGNSSLEGGAIVYADEGFLNITNSTISDNAGVDVAGGLFVRQFPNSKIDILNTTISNNTSIAGANIYNAGSAVTATNTIVSTESAIANCAGSQLTSLGNNLSSDASCGFTSDNNDFIDTNPLLGVLADNGGMTRTMSLQAGSPAIDAADETACTRLNKFDQRYFYRSDGACDIGAFEYESVLAQSGELVFSVSELVTIEGQASFDVTVKRINGTDGNVSARTFISADSTAKAEDYEFVANRLHWLDGQSDEKILTVLLKNNTLIDNDKTLIFKLGGGSGNVTISDAEALTVTIRDDELLPGIVQFSDVEFVVSESKEVVEVFIARTDGTMGDISFTVDSDRFPSVVNTIDDGQRGVVLQFDIRSEGDSIYDGDVHYNLTLSNVTNGAVLGGRVNAKIIIEDDEVLPVNPGEVSFGSADYIVQENASKVEIEINRMGGLDGNMAAFLEVSNGAADFGGLNDENVIRKKLGFAAGVNTLILSVDILDDELVEQDEILTLKITNLKGGVLAGNLMSTTITIVDNDSVPSPSSTSLPSSSLKQSTDNVVVKKESNAGSVGLFTLLAMFIFLFLRLIMPHRRMCYVYSKINHLFS